MKVNEFYQESLANRIKECNIVDVKVHADDNNDVRAIEVKYVPNESMTASGGDIKVPEFLKKGGRQ